MLALGYRQLQPLDRRHGDVRISVAELALVLRQSRNAVADDRAAAHPAVHGVAHQAGRAGKGSGMIVDTRSISRSGDDSIEGGFFLLIENLAGKYTSLSLSLDVSHGNRAMLVLKTFKKCIFSFG